VAACAVGAAAIAAVLASHAVMTAAETPAPTFSKDVLPILQKNCQGCHRPGQIAPMSLLTYEQARPWARDIKTKVASRQMPPWFADPQYGHFSNNRALSQSDVDTIVRWVDTGAPAGNPKDAPPSIVWPEDGWQIQPDVIVKGPEFVVPAHPTNNVIEWTTIIVPSGFTKDTWITSMEVKPSDLSVTHHICVTFRQHTPDVQYYTPTWTDRSRDEEGVAFRTQQTQTPQAQAAQQAQAQGTVGRNALPTSAGSNEGCYVPGVQADDYRPYHAGKLIPAGTDISVQVHYTPTGKEVIDRPLIGFTVSESAPEKRWLSYNISGAGPTFAIPPNEGNYQSPPADAEFTADAELVEMMPHMHVRGKDMTYHLIYPDGRDEIVLSVPKYDFNWQLVYRPAAPIHIPKGTKLHVEAHYDNSTANKFNPNPNRTVYPGNMTWEEMMSPFFGVITDLKTDARTLLKRGRNTVVGDGA
jgi:hypothetical protein